MASWSPNLSSNSRAVKLCPSFVYFSSPDFLFGFFKISPMPLLSVFVSLLKHFLWVFSTPPQLPYLKLSDNFPILMTVWPGFWHLFWGEWFPESSWYFQDTCSSLLTSEDIVFIPISLNLLFVPVSLENLKWLFLSSEPSHFCYFSNRNYSGPHVPSHSSCWVVFTLSPRWKPKPLSPTSLLWCVV